MISYRPLPDGIFAPKPTDGLQPLFKNTGTARRFRQGQIIMRRDTIPQSVVLITAGRVFAVHYTLSGDRRVLGIYETGNTIGLAEMLTGRCCGVTFVAATDTTAREIEYADVKMRMQTNFDAVLRVIENITVNNEIEFTRMLGNMEFDVGVRIANTLLDMAAVFGTDENGIICIDVCPTQSNIADIVAGHRVTVNKVLQDLKKNRLVEVSDMEYRILDRRGLIEWRDIRLGNK